MAERLPFGSAVLVRAETVRVIVEPFDGRHRFHQSLPLASAGRYLLHDFSECTTWPGEPMPLAWAPGRKGYDPDPTPSRAVTARARRLILNEPEDGVVIGSTFRREGEIAAVDGSNHLLGPGRSVELIEVALTPGTSGKARLVLVHRNDLALRPSGKSVAAGANYDQ